MFDNPRADTAYNSMSSGGVVMRCSAILAVMIGGAMGIEVLACETLPARMHGDIAADPAALRIFWQLLEQARFGFSRLEEAAFIVRDASGTVSEVPWPAAGEPNTGKWIGAFPANTIAIVHTHPNWMPSPSSIDVRTAQRTRVPVYVITRSHIAKTAGGSTTMLLDGEWKPGDVCGTSGGHVDLAQANARRSDGSARGGGARHWPWSAWQRRSGRAAADHAVEGGTIHVGDDAAWIG
jgi:hypothetical protein